MSRLERSRKSQICGKRHDLFQFIYDHNYHLKTILIKNGPKASRYEDLPSSSMRDKKRSKRNCPITRMKDGWRQLGLRRRRPQFLDKRKLIRYQKILTPHSERQRYMFNAWESVSSADDNNSPLIKFLRRNNFCFVRISFLPFYSRIITLYRTDIFACHCIL